MTLTIFIFFPLKVTSEQRRLEVDLLNKHMYIHVCLLYIQCICFYYQGNQQ